VASGGLVEGQQYATMKDGKYVKFTYAKLTAKPSIIKPEFFADVFTTVQDSKGYELPGFLSFPIFCQLFLQHVLKSWKQPTLDAFSKIVKLGSAVVKSAVKASLRQQQQEHLHCSDSWSTKWSVQSESLRMILNSNYSSCSETKACHQHSTTISLNLSRN
jgi:hypothetical protein